MRAHRYLHTAGLALLLVSCTRAPSDSPPDTPTARTGGSAADLQSEVIRLEAKLRNLASTSGCDTAAQCKTAPVGARACGGPREYIVYCAATTDETALLAVVDSLEQAERRHNEKTGAGSTCEFRMPPGVELSEGACRESGNRE